MSGFVQCAVAELENIEEVRVTARWTEESLLKLTVAVTALSACQIQMLGLANLKDVSRFTPSSS